MDPGERSLQLGHREPVADTGEHGADMAVHDAQLHELGAEQLALELGAATLAVHGGLGRVDPDLAVGVDRARAELDAGDVALADRPKAHDHTEGPGVDAGLVGGGDERGVGQRSGLDGVLVGEVGPEEVTHVRVHRRWIVDPAGEHLEPAGEGGVEVVVACGEPGTHRGQCARHLVGAQGEHAIDHVLGTVATIVGVDPAGHERAAHHPGGVGAQGNVGSLDVDGAHHRISRAGTSARAAATWSADRPASVDSAPWFRFTVVAHQPVPRPARVLHVQLAPGVVVADEPLCGSPGTRPPDGIARLGEGPVAGVRHRGGLDGLLVERRAELAGGPASVRHEAEVVPACLDGNQPAQQPQAHVDQRRLAEGGPGGEQRLGDPGVVVGQPVLHPRHVAEGRVRQGLDAPAQELAGLHVCRVGGQQLRCPEHCEGVGAQVDRREAAGVDEGLQGGVADRPQGAPTGGDPQGPPGAPLRVVGPDLVEPVAIGVPAVVERPDRRPGLQHEGEVGAGEVVDHPGPPGVSAHDDQRPGVVVGAQAVRDAGRGELGVLPDAQQAGQVHQVVEPRGGDGWPRAPGPCRMRESPRVIRRHAASPRVGTVGGMPVRPAPRRRTTPRTGGRSWASPTPARSVPRPAPCARWPAGP